MSNPIFLKFIKYDGKPIVVDMNKVKCFYEREYKEDVCTLLQFESENEVWVQSSFEDVCKALSNWCVVDGTHLK